MQYNVLDGFYPWVREGCIACIGGQGGFQCSGDVYASNHAQRTVGTLQLPFCFVVLREAYFLLVVFTTDSVFRL